jgi:capsular exopolysaccharide synthesis family protein
MEIRRYLAILLRWWWLVILLPVVTAALGYGVSQKLPRVYQATTTVMVGQTIQATSLSELNFETNQHLAQTYRDIALRQPVLQGVIDTLDLKGSWKALKEELHVNLVPETQLLEITVEAASAEQAQLIADEVARQLILLSSSTKPDPESEENQRFVQERLKRLQVKIQAGQERVQALEARAATSLPSTVHVQLQQEINSLETLISGWENNFSQLLVFHENKEAPNHLTVVEPAQVDPGATRPYDLLNTFLAGILGFCLAVGIIVLLEYFHETFETADDLKRFLGITVLGTIGRVRGKNYLSKLVISQPSNSLIRETFRMIRSSIQFVSINRQVKSILITSSLPGEGKSLIAANLGIVMAQGGLKTIIVDADLRQPVLHQIFEVSNEEGLADLLLSPEVAIKNYLRETEIRNLQILTSGSIPPEASDLLGSKGMEQLIESLNEIADVVIYDSPPVLVVTDAAVLANQVDGVVFVIGAKQTQHDAARRALSNLQQADAHLLGAILNRISNRSWSYYYRRYYGSRSRRERLAVEPIQAVKIIKN